MIKHIVSTFAFVLYASLLFAKIITVSNNPNSPGQYKRLDSAIYFAANYDILLVSGSAVDYAASPVSGTIVINKPLILYGQGYDPRKDQAMASVISAIHITPSGSGTTISGFWVPNQLYTDYNTNNITISRCRINSIMNSSSKAAGVSGNYYDIRENIIGDMAIAAYNITFSIGHIMIHNNIITGSIGGPATAIDIVVNNNYFTANDALDGAGFSGSLNNASVNNNIFFYKSTSQASAATAAVNCAFNNNIYYNYTTTMSNPFNIGVNRNTGSNNINANPLFASIDLTTASIIRSDNFTLKPGSPGIGTGSDGKDIGLHGGSLPAQYPYSGQPAIPQIQSMNILNQVIPSNGTLNVTFRASANN